MRYFHKAFEKYFNHQGQLVKFDGWALKLRTMVISSALNGDCILLNANPCEGSIDNLRLSDSSSFAGFAAIDTVL
ncbi:hypothetical protein [Endozoicomonas acroporae]|uniref:hypothetical protein n=1 Tax=Endozoicomonas acroporae TaxID=1701104 RepID=UPI0013D84897|nr:hypothetical protein [Endozoicomonas acroporae]